MAIVSFKNKETEEIAHGKKTKRTVKLLPTELHYVAYKKLIFLDNIKTLESLRAWPGLRLEKLSGTRKEQYSIRINDKYRICFNFNNGEVLNVEIIDYH
ncbi:type II toxin-antitoxin system RelE/ParE family toxin [bacterium]|nr:type II toxin-antitoxin system RelE/ParE family toxin [bacterium]